MASMRIGFIGLGEMGKPMAKNLLRNGFRVTICGHRRREPVEELKSLRAIEVISPLEVAESSEIIVVMVRDIPQTEEVILGKNFWEKRGIWQGIKTGSIVILCSTLKPDYCRQLADKAKGKGFSVVDGPVSGGYPRAEAGTLTFMVGGDKAVIERCMPVFRGMGKDIYYLGGAGTGQAMKLINNYMMVVTAYGASEAIAMGLKAGLGLEQMLEIIKMSSGNSAVIADWNILARHQREFSESNTGSRSIFKKDVALAIDFAREIGVGTDFGQLVMKSDESILFPTESLKNNSPTSGQGKAWDLRSNGMS